MGIDPVRPIAASPVTLVARKPAKSLSMEIAPRFIVHETAHWIINHHMASALPGYLMLGSREHVGSLSELPGAALAELGSLLAQTQQVMETQLKPKWLYISRFGHVPGYPIHFHFIPVYHWVEALFWKDERYRLLEKFATPDNAESTTDGAELTLFIWREFGESNDPPPIQGISIGQSIERLRAAFQSPCAGQDNRMR
ncbi:hypothetical protein D3C80_234780 [compost metagenome]